jgi:hypothetical protein
MNDRAAFYARTGSRRADLVSLLHLPYTRWHVSYVAIGAALAETLDWLVLVGSLLAFVVGLGVGAHALDEVKSRPLATSLSDRTLWVLGLGAMLVAAVIAVIGAFVVSPWVAAWGGAGVLLATGYALEWPLIHSDLGFALGWGGFPVLVGYWAQTQSIGLSVVVVGAAATLLSLAQRRLSTPARFVRRRTRESVAAFDGGRQWERAELLATWETPLRLLAWTMATLAVGLLVGHV